MNIGCQRAAYLFLYTKHWVESAMKHSAINQSADQPE